MSRGHTLRRRPGCQLGTLRTAAPAAIRAARLLVHPRVPTLIQRHLDKPGRGALAGRAREGGS